jgi:hypothetical protein
MFEMLDIMISLAVVFLILSMVHKYLVSLIKRLLSIKAKVVADEMKTLYRGKHRAVSDSLSGEKGEASKFSGTTAWCPFHQKKAGWSAAPSPSTSST